MDENAKFKGFPVVHLRGSLYDFYEGEPPLDVFEWHFDGGLKKYVMYIPASKFVCRGCGESDVVVADEGRVTPICAGCATAFMSFERTGGYYVVEPLNEQKCCVMSDVTVENSLADPPEGGI